MSLEIEEMKFRGLIALTVEKETGASIYEDTEKLFLNALCEAYRAAGSPKNKNAWVRQQIKNRFVSLTTPPVWIEKMTTPRWPFVEGEPMVFIEQITVSENDVSKASLSPGAVLYIFGGRKPVKDVPGAWEMVYRVIAQVPGL